MSAHRLVELGLEAQVAVGDDADHACRAFDHGRPEMRCCCVSVEHVAHVMSGGDRDRILDDAALEALDLGDFGGLRLRGDMFLWTMPMPPSCAMAIARRASVTVSIAAEATGMLSGMVRVRRVLRLTSRGRTVEWAGTRRTSSKVRAFWTTRMFSPRKVGIILLSCMKRLFAVLVLLMACTGAALAQQYKWVNADGKVPLRRRPAARA